MPFWFFLSYARADRNEWLDQFFADLCEEVRLKSPVTLPPEQLAFRDTRNIEPGHEWEPELADALRTSRLCVCLCSPRYLDSTYCGKEYTVFCERYDGYVQTLSHGSPRPRVIFPLLWEWLPNGVPSVVSRFQYSHQDYPEAYTRHGLRYLMKLSWHQDDYRQIVDRLACALVEAGREHLLPDLPGLRPLRHVENAFHVAPADSPGTEPAQSVAGPNVVKFVYVAARPSELDAIRASLDNYSNQGGWYWRPYLPTADDSVGMLAQTAASKLKFRYLELSLGEDLRERLREAESRNEVVLVLVDPWSVRLQQYADLMVTYDMEMLANSSVLVPWNHGDPETSSNRMLLEQALRRAFPQKSLLGPPNHHWDTICSVGDLSATLEQALTVTRITVIEMGKNRRKAESSVLTQEAQQQGISIDTKPNISGPVGGAP